MSNPAPAKVSRDRFALHTVRRSAPVQTTRALSPRTDDCPIVVNASLTTSGSNQKTDVFVSGLIMFFVRLGVLLAVLILVLPIRPPIPSVPTQDIRTSDSHGFCESYPRTCRASWALAVAVRTKIEHALNMLRQLVEPASIRDSYARTTEPLAQKLPERYAPNVVLPVPNPRNTLSAMDRTPSWRARRLR